MQTYSVNLECKPVASFYSEKAANSVDLDIKKKLTHSINIDADITTDFNIGLIIGNSGSGKTTLAKEMFGKNIFSKKMNMKLPIIDQFSDDIEYKDRVKILTGIGLNSIPCWIKPVGLLSNGQKARAEAAILMTSKKLPVIDEFTSVVDRTIGKIMSHCVQKYVRKNKKKIVLISCHYDIIDWLDPDWIIDLTEQKYIDRRSLRQSRKEKIKFEIRECDRKSWKGFSKYHYLSERLPGGKIWTYGLYLNDKQIGFQCFANYTPFKKNHSKMIVHSNRTVIHPDYQGLGLGIMMVNATCLIVKKNDVKIMAKFSNTAMHKSRQKMKEWRFLSEKMNTSKAQRKSGRNMERKAGFRTFVKTYQYEYIGSV